MRSQTFAGFFHPNSPSTLVWTTVLPTIKETWLAFPTASLRQRRAPSTSEHPLRGWKPWELTVNQAHSNKGPLWVSAWYTTGHSGETTHHTARPLHPDTPALRCRARPQECISHHMQLALSSDTVFHLQWRTKKQSHQSSWIPWVQETFSCKLHSLLSLEDLPSAII